MAPPLSICLCVKNGERTLDVLLHSLLPQAHQLHVPVFCFDHESSDQTNEILAKYALRYPDTLFVETFREPGLGRIRDAAWRETSSNWVAFVDADCRVASDWVGTLLQLVAEYESRTESVAVGGKNLTPNDSFFYRACRIMLGSWVGGHDSTLNRADEEARPVAHLPTLNVLYRRSALESIQGFDHRFLRVGEDLDLSFRLRERGGLLWYEPRLVVTHHFRARAGDWLRNMWVYGMGRSLFIRVHPRSFEPKFVLPLVVLGGVVVTLGLALIPYFILIAFLLRESRRNEKESFTAWMYAALILVATHVTLGWGMIDQQIRNPLKFRSRG